MIFAVAFIFACWTMTALGTDTSGNLSGWIENGEKYALVGLSIKFEGHLPPERITPNLWVLADPNFNVPSHWQNWLGSIRAREVGDCNLFLLSKVASLTPAVLDAENQKLEQRALNFYVGLVLASTFAPAHRPVLLTGSRRDGEIDIHEQKDFDAPIPCLFRPYPPVGPEDVRLAAQLGENLDALATAPLPGGHWRLFRTCISTRSPARYQIFLIGFTNTAAASMA